MAKIENTSVYPTVTPSSDDLLIGTDVSDDNKTVTFLVSSLTGGVGINQGLQSVLDTGNVATQDITLTGDITVIGTVAPTTITAGGSTGTAGQILSSTGSGLQWIDSPSVACCSLEATLSVGNTTTIGITTTGSIRMTGAGQVLALSGGTDMTLASGSTLTTADAINLGTTINFGATTTLNDYSGSTGSAGAVLTVNSAGTGVEWSLGLPTVSTPTAQQVFVKGNNLSGIGLNFTGPSSTTFDSTAVITSAGNNTFSGTNSYSANGATSSTAGIALSGTLYDGASVGTSGQVLTSTGTGVSWASTAGVTSVTGQTETSSTGSALTVTPTSGAVQITPHIYAGGSNIGVVPAGGTSSSYLKGDGTWGAIACCNLADTLAVGNTANNISITLTGTGVFQGPKGDFEQLQDSLGTTGSAGQVLTCNSGATGMEWQNPKSGFAHTYKFNNNAVQMNQNEYYTFLAIDDSNFDSLQSSVTNSLGTDSPTAGSYSEQNYFAGIIFANGQASSCSSFQDSQVVCSVDYSIMSNTAGDFEFTLWKVPACSLDTGVQVAQCSISASANTIGCCSATLTGANTTIPAGSALFFTVRQTGTAGAFTPKIQGRVDVKFNQI